MPFVTLNDTTIRIQSNGMGLKFDEHGLDRERQFDGSMRQIRRGIYRRWEGNTAILTEGDANTLIALLTSNSVPLALEGDLVPSETVAVMPVLISNDPMHVGGGVVMRRIVFTLHETNQNLPPDTSASVWLFWQRATGMFQELDGTVPSLHGDPLGVWEDQSGHNRHHVAGQDAGPDTRPTNDSGAARFPDGVPWLIIPSDFAFLTGGEIMMRLQADADPPLSAEDLHSRLHSLGSVSGGASAFYPKLDAHIYDGFGSTVLYDCGNPSDDLTEWNVFNTTSTAAEGFISRLNNTTLFSKTVAAGHVVDYSGAGFTFGGALPNVNNSWFGRVSDIVIFDAALNTAQRASWYNYMIGLADDPPLP